MADIAIRMQNLGHAYQRDAWVFRGLTVEIAEGRTVAVLGRNGSGKTTLLRILARAITPAEGSASIAGTAAFVPQLFQVSFDYRALDLVLMGRARHVGLLAQPSRADDGAALAALDRCGAGDLSQRRFQELSGGQRQLVLIARALASEARLLILDEPMSSLDLGHQARALSWVSRLAEDGLTVVFSTHDPSHALAVADDVLILQDEERFSFGAASELLSEQQLQAVYGLAVTRVQLEHEGQRFETVVPILPARKALRDPPQ